MLQRKRCFCDRHVAAETGVQILPQGDRTWISGRCQSLFSSTQVPIVIKRSQMAISQSP
ncbi:hypothetical protein [Oscillatoria acuminata]|uniref:hypothetical protein n=1 Tax=Oscillatoria acuminata TaxID=118323 RepID=UPI0012EA322B|nr:hypothetical protein [Oscillatoria acuminata]